MGYTRVIYTDATTAEAATVLKSSGFLEGNQGGCYTSAGSPIKAYVVWGRSQYYPDIVARLDFAPRIQIHLKSRENGPDLLELALGTAAGLRGLSPETRVKVFDTDTKQEISC